MDSVEIKRLLFFSSFLFFFLFFLGQVQNMMIRECTLGCCTSTKGGVLKGWMSGWEEMGRGRNTCSLFTCRCLHVDVYL